MAFLQGVVVYINGVRIDPLSVSYHAEDGGDYGFTVNVPAVAEWDILPERSHGAVFFLDPVTQTWRFMCEGEYVSVAKGKSAEGTRNRSLIFRSIFGWWNQATYSSFVSMTRAPNIGGALTEQVLWGRAQGRVFPFQVTSEGEEGFKIESFIDIITKATDGNAAKTIPAFFPIFLRNAALQTPVEAYYMSVRRLNHKIHAMDDYEIAGVVSLQLFKEMIVNGLSAFLPRPDMPVDEVIRHLEDIAFYCRKPLPAPFMFAGGDKIMEFMWTPHLFSVMTPVCNVIFDTQITATNEQRNFLSEPTRVIVQVKHPAVARSDGMPVIFMANEVDSYNINSLITEPTITDNSSLAMTHDFMSKEEMRKGVVHTTVGLGMEKVFNTTPDTEEGTAIEQSALMKLIGESATHHFMVEKARARQASLSCTFLPYIAVGFPCLVEDKAGPYFGIVHSVSHSMPSTGAPSTTITLTHVRPAYIQQGVPRSPKNPVWLNKIYLPSNIEKTYENVLGIDKSSPVRNYTSIMHGTSEADMDVAASGVVAVPRYTENNEKVDDGSASNTVSSQLMKKPDPQLACYQWQYRKGMSLTDYAKFHGLSGAGNFDNSASLLNAGLPAKLTSDTMFGYPNGLEFKGQTGSQTLDVINTEIFGVYKVVGGINNSRVNASQTIADAIARGIASK